MTKFFICHKEGFKRNSSSTCINIEGSDHLLDKSVDQILTVTSRTTLDEVLELSSNTPTSVWVRELEWPQEVVSLLEVRTNGVNLVDQVLDGNNTVLSKRLLDDSVVIDRDSLLVDLGVTTLVDELSDGSKGWVSVSDVRLDKLEQLCGSFGNLDESGSVDLVESQELEDLSWLWSNLVDTLNSHDEDKLRLSWNEVVSSLTSLLLSIDESLLGISVLLVVGLGSLVDGSSLLSGGLYVSKDTLCERFSSSSSSAERWCYYKQHRRG